MEWVRAGVRVLLHESPSDTWQSSPYRLLTAGACYDLVLLPTRAEPYGPIGHEALSAGLPTLVAEQSALASIINRLTPDPANYLGKTSSSCHVFNEQPSVLTLVVLVCACVRARVFC